MGKPVLQPRPYAHGGKNERNVMIFHRESSSVI
jgi:hypothetical protein